MATQSTPLPAVAREQDFRRSRPLVRALLPAFPDLLFVALLFWLFAGVPNGWTGLLADADTGWHIRTGEYILQTRTVPTTDLFSFSKPGDVWFAWEWAADVVFALLFRAAGLKAIVLFGGVLICGTIAVLFLRMLRSQVNIFIALALAVLAAGGSSIHYLARPHVFTLILMALSVWLLDRDRERPSRWLWSLVPLTVAWTNLHGGFLALIASTGVVAAGAAVEGALAGRNVRAAWDSSRRYFTLAGLCGAATFLNPYGYNLHIHVGNYLTSDWIRSVIGEFQSPSFRAENVIQFEVLLLAGVLVSGHLFWKRRIAAGLLILFWAHMSLSSARHIPIFIIVAAPWMAVQLNEWWDRATGGASRKSVLGILRQVSADAAAGQGRLGVFSVVVVALLPIVDQSPRWPADFPESRFPVKAVNQNAGAIREARMLTTDQWGDYLIFRFYPAQRVFVDGRSDFYGREIGQQYLDMWAARHNWRELVERWKFTAVLIPTDWPLATVMKTDPDWRVEYDDSSAILFLRREFSWGAGRAKPPDRTNEIGERCRR